MTQIIFSLYLPIDLNPLLLMALKLWKDYEEKELKNSLAQTAESNTQRIIIAKNADGQYVGFSIFSIRTDYVEGADKSPTGYLEGIFIEQAFRKIGIAKEFIQRGERWCKEKGCTQIGSDTWLRNGKKITTNSWLSLLPLAIPSALRFIRLNVHRTFTLREHSFIL